MENNENKDTRGYDLRVDNFRTQLESLINNSGLYPSTVLYLLKDITNEVNSIYNQAVNIQYKNFCEEANKEVEQEEKKDEAEQ